MSVPSLSALEPGARVWVRDPDCVWAAALVEGPGDAANTVRVALVPNASFASGSVAPTTRTVGQGDVFLANPPPAEGMSSLEAAIATHDLAQLTQLHEASILNAVHIRFVQDCIYTATGRILLAVNPFREVPLFGDDVMDMFQSAMAHDIARSRNGGAPVASTLGLRSQSPLESTGTVSPAFTDDSLPSLGNSSVSSVATGIDALPPHVFGIAGTAYARMVATPLSSSAMAHTPVRPKAKSVFGTPTPATPGLVSGGGGWQLSRNQSILVSGESGAGKTETTKFIMRYLSSVTPDGESHVGMDAKIMVSNPILESFGNAKTHRNDNSSRFGKFIEMRFSPEGHLIGGKVNTYLLEKVRVVSQSPGERNFHAFYQLCNGATETMKKLWNIGRPEDYEYLKHSGCSSIPRVNDQKNFQMMAKSMIALGFTHAEMQGTCKTLAAILNLGNLVFVPKEDGAEISPASTKALDTMTSLMGLEPAAVIDVLTTRRIEAPGVVIRKPVPPDAAAHARDAMAKYIYGKMFDWIVHRTNEFLGQTEPGYSFVGILDIFGFETFNEKSNSFEQLCINFTNEALQQQFNQYVFKLEQEVYTAEGVAWQDVDFADNIDCLGLIEVKIPPGILALLEQECLMPKGTDQSFARKLYDNLGQHPGFSAPPRERAQYKFILTHYAGPVPYDTKDFCDKNKDAISADAVALLQTSSDPVASAFFAVAPSAVPEPDSSSSGGGQRKPTLRSGMSTTVSSAFRTQLRVLMDTVRSTTPQFVRCLKPNHRNTPNDFDRRAIVEQLRYSGVLEAARVSRLGYPIRMTHVEFLDKYHALKPSVLPPNERVACQSLAAAVTSLSPTDCQVGTTRVFLRNDGFQLLQAALSARLLSCTLRLQSVWRGHSGRRVASKRLQCAILVQSVCRMCAPIAQLRALRRGKAATTIQSLLRMRACCVAYGRTLSAVKTMQSVARMCLAKRVVTGMRRQRAAVRIQASVRCWLAEMAFNDAIDAICQIQAAMRCRLFRKRVQIVAQFRKETRAAIRIQSIARMAAGRRTLEKLRQQRKMVQDVTLLQSLVRRWAAIRACDRIRQERKQGSSAVRVQCWIRCVWAQRALTTLQQQRAQTEATLTIQCSWRRYCCRKALAVRKHQALRVRSARMIQCFWRCACARVAFGHLRLKKAKQVDALRIQSQWRRVLAQRVLWTLKLEQLKIASALRIQCSWRCTRARRELAQLQLAAAFTASALTAQRVWRGYVVRCDYIALLTNRDQAATRIQCSRRCQLARRAAGQLRNTSVRYNSAWRIQLAYRCAKARRVLSSKQAVVDKAARTIQRACRPTLTLWTLNRLVTRVRAAATTVQCAVRCHQSKRALVRRRKEFVVSLQEAEVRLAKESAAKDKEIEGLRIRLDNATRRLQDEIAEKQALAQEVHSLKGELCCSKADLRVKASMLEAARDVQRENESLQGTVTRLKGLLREARESVEELPVVVEANQLLTQERDRLQRELLQLQIRAEAADDLRSQNDALSQELSRAREEIERLRACESKSFHPFTISSMHQSSEESKPDSRAEVDVEVTPAFHFSQLLSLSNGWGPEGKEEEGGGGETIRSWSVSPEEGRDWLREREEEAEGLQRALLGEEQWTPSGIDDDTMTTLSASTGNPRSVSQNSQSVISRTASLPVRTVPNSRTTRIHATPAPTPPSRRVRASDVLSSPIDPKGGSLRPRRVSLGSQPQQGSPVRREAQPSYTSGSERRESQSTRSSVPSVRRGQRSRLQLQLQGETPGGNREVRVSPAGVRYVPIAVGEACVYGVPADAGPSGLRSVLAALALSSSSSTSSRRHTVK